MKATVVSFVPWEIRETKPGIVPDEFKLQKSDGKVPAVLVIENAVSNVYIDADRGTFPVPVTVETLGRSITEDASKAHLEIDTDAKPALFWVEGAHTPQEVLQKFPKECEEAKRMQNRWFMRLIKSADDSWARFHQHKMIGDLQRLAAGILGLQKEWAITPEPVTLIKCPACTTMIESDAIVCKNCRTVIRPEAAQKLGLKFASL